MLQISGLNKTYGNGVHALRDVTLEVGTGMFGLLGPNGAGKSSLMRTIATLQEADSGSVTFQNTNVVADVNFLRRQLGYLPQEFGVYPRTSPLAFLDHLAVMKGITNKAERQAMVEALLVRTNLWDVRKKSMTTFSGGMKQRIGIAQALLGSPQLIIVDEPTAGLDPVERRRFHNLLAEIGSDVAVILSTHIVEDVADLCTRMAIMANGQILKAGQPNDLIDNLRGRLWRRVVDREHDAQARAAVPILATRRVAGRLELTAVADTQPPEFAAAEPNLEDVYFASLADAGINIEVD
ncbi:MAG: ABC transporter ATP-binding protein [Pseudomonadota bacterium]